MQPIGTIRKSENKTYGKYNSVCIARVDMSKVYSFPNFGDDWSDKFHPKVYFGSYGWEKSEPEPSRFINYYVPLLSYNKKWLQENPDCEYVRDMEGKSKVKYLPTAISTKSYLKWLANSRQMLDDFLSPEAAAAGI